MMRYSVATAIAARLAVPVIMGAGTASAAEISHQYSLAQVIPDNHELVFGPYGTFQQCDDELTYVMGYTGFISSTGCFEGRGGNSWLFKAIFAGPTPV